MPPKKKKKVYESWYFALFVVSGFTEKLRKAFLNWLCQYCFSQQIVNYIFSIVFSTDQKCGVNPDCLYRNKFNLKGWWGPVVIGKCQKFQNSESTRKYNLVWPNNSFAFFLNIFLRQM